MNEGEIAAGEFVVTGSQAAEVHELAEPVFDFVTAPVKPPGMRGRLEASGTGWDDALDSVAFQAGAHAVRIIGPIGGQSDRPARFLRLGIKGIEADQVVALASGQSQSNRRMLVGAGRMQLGSQASSRASKSLIWTVFFGAPAAWGWAGMLVLSTNNSSRAGVAPRESTSHNRCHTPAFSQRRKRMYTALHRPYSSGRSRHGNPARVRYSTASRNSRSSKPGGAPRTGFTSASAADSCSHIALFSSFRAIPLYCTRRLHRSSSFVNTP